MAQLVAGAAPAALADQLPSIAFQDQMPDALRGALTKLTKPADRMALVLGSPEFQLA